jgi:hypothetical protein
MGWSTILMLLLQYLPELLTLIWDLWRRKGTLSPAVADALRVEFQQVLQSPLSRKEKRRRLKEILLRESLSDLKR